MKKVLLLFFSLLFNFSISSQTFYSRGVGGGGALFSPSINPADNDEYYVACDMSELFHSTDFGLNYDLVHFNELQGGHNSKVCFTSNPSVRYCVNYDDDMVVPVKSTDGGTTWTKLSGNPDDGDETFSIYANYNNANQVILGTYGSIYFSNDGGTSFTNIHNAVNSGNGVVIGGVFFDGNNIYIGTNDGVLVSTNSGGAFSTANITGLPTNERIFSFAGAKSGNTTRFYCLTGDVNDIYVGLPGSDYYGFMQGIYSVDYGSGNWTAKMGGINVGSDFPMFVAMAENDINTCYLAGSNDNSEPIVLKTMNGGTLWSNTFLTASNQNITSGWSGAGGDRGWSYGECPFGFDVSDNNKDVLIFSDFGFVHKSNNGGTIWDQAYVDVTDQNPAGSNTPKYQYYHSVGLENTTCWQVFWFDAQTMFAAFSDIKGIRSTDGGVTWGFDYTGHNANSMYRLVKDNTTSAVYAGTSNIHDMYQSTRLQDAILDGNDTEGKIIYTTDKGKTWQLLHSFGHPVFWVATDPNDNNRMYASVIHSTLGGIYVTNNLQSLGSSTWTKLSNPPRTEGHPASINVLNDGKVVCTYSGRRNSSGTFTASSGVFIYDPQNTTWTDVSDPGMHYWTKDLVIDPYDATQNTWYTCVFSGWGGAPNGKGGIYRTTNRGQNWTKINSLDRVTSITFHPTVQGIVYITTEQDGLWTSNNINVTTPMYTQVASYPFRQPERVFFDPYDPNNEVWVTSFGNGMKMGDPNITSVPHLSNEKYAPVLFPNPATEQLTIRLNAEGYKTAIVYNCLGEKVIEKNIALNQQLVYLSLEGLPDGVYHVTFTGEKEQISSKFIKQQ